MKVFKPSMGRDADTEFSIFNTVSSSPFLLHCLDAFVGPFDRTLLLEYAPFGNLDILTRTVKGLGHDTIKQYAKEMALALSFLHSHHIIHGDVKPENVLILASGHVVLADFNRAYRMTSDAPTTSNICGTFLTRPPEVWDRIPYDQSVDVWMYGVSLYNIASNKWPFLHVSTARHVEAVKTGHVTFLDPFFSPDLVSLIQRTLQVESWARIPTDQILGHDYFTSLGQSDEAPLSPFYLHSILMATQTERDIIEDILRQDTPALDPQPQDTPTLNTQLDRNHEETPTPDSELHENDRDTPNLDPQLHWNHEETPTPDSQLHRNHRDTPTLDPQSQASNEDTPVGGSGGYHNSRL